MTPARSTRVPATHDALTPEELAVVIDHDLACRLGKDAEGEG